MKNKNDFPDTNNHCIDCPYFHKEDNKLPIRLECNHSKILLLFQTPGKDEWEGNTYNSKRTPVASINPHSAGYRIKNSLSRIKKTRCDFDYAEVVMCYPGKYNNGRDKKPSKLSIKNCINYLQESIDLYSYQKIICFGKVAEEAIKNIEFSKKVEVVFCKHPNAHLTNDDLDEVLK